MIDSHDFKRKSAVPNEFERRRTERLLEEFVSEKASFLHNGPGEVRYRQRGWTIELYQAQPHPVHKMRVIRLPVALFQGARDGQSWKLYYRGQSGHWQAYPDPGSAFDDPVEAPFMRLTAALDLVAADELGLFW